MNILFSIWRLTASLARVSRQATYRISPSRYFSFDGSELMG